MGRKSLQKIWLLLICFILIFTAACSGSENLPLTKELEDIKTTESSIQSNVEDQTASGDQSSLETQTDQSKSTSQQAVQSSAEKSVDAAGQINNSNKEERALIVKGSGVTTFVTLTMDDLKNLGTNTYIYSGRNKEKANERQYFEYTGVLLEKILKSAGWDGKSDTMRLTCSDGYSGKYRISEINGYLSFVDAADETGSTVPAMLGFLNEGDSLGNDRYYDSSKGLPLRLIYGQADYDSEWAKDFNMQGWAFGISEIEIY